VRKRLLPGMILLSLLISTTSCGADEKSSRSQGCGRAAPAAPPISHRVGGHMREFISVVPESYDSSVAHRLIFAFHGRTTPNKRVRKYYRIEPNSRKPTIFVYPAGLIAADGKYSWYERSNPRDQLRDFYSRSRYGGRAHLGHQVQRPGGGNDHAQPTRRSGPRVTRAESQGLGPGPERSGTAGQGMRTQGIELRVLWPAANTQSGDLVPAHGRLQPPRQILSPSLAQRSRGRNHGIL